MKRLPIAVAVAAFALMGATGAFAKPPHTQLPKVGGTVLQTVKADHNYNRANGNNSVARQAFGVINANTSGKVTQNVTADHNENYAQGNGSEACQTFGVIGPVSDICNKK